MMQVSKFNRQLAFPYSFMRVETTEEVATSVLVNSSPLAFARPASLSLPLPNRLISKALTQSGNETKPNPAAAARRSIKTNSCSFGNQPTLLRPIQPY